jgi:hypothetical protein
MHPATPQADVAIVEAHEILGRHTGTLTRLRADLAKMRLPIPQAEDRLDHLDDILAIAASQLLRAWAVMDEHATRIEAEDDARYEAANDDDETNEAEAA